MSAKHYCPCTRCGKVAIVSMIQPLTDSDVGIGLNAFVCYDCHTIVRLEE